MSFRSQVSHLTHALSLPKYPFSEHSQRTEKLEKGKIFNVLTMPMILGVERKKVLSIEIFKKEQETRSGMFE